MLFVGLSVPLSMAIAYLIIPGLGFTLNMIVMFAFIFCASGIVVDDAIVVIENTHRIHAKYPDIRLAAKLAAGEVFLPSCRERLRRWPLLPARLGPASSDSLCTTCRLP